jgi:hypothetical protein
MPKLSAKERVASVAGRQLGRISRAQLRGLGIADATIHHWLATGYLIRVLPGVYAVGHRAKSIESDLMAAVLYAGPGAMLSHTTAAWWLGLTDSRPYGIDVSTPRRCRPLPGIRVHQRRRIEREWHRGLPVTTLVRTLIDYAAKASLSKVRLALARADYHRGLEPRTLEAQLGSGQPGAGRVRTALREHQPCLARTRSGLEIVFFELCEAGSLPLPEVNARICGWDVDALWRQQRLVVEIDGPRNHRSPAQIRRDHRKDLELRGAGVTVLRYSDDQIERQAAAVMAELRRQLTPPALSA